MQNFTKAYWLDKKRILPTKADCAEMYAEDYYELAERAGVTMTYPLVVKIRNLHLPVYPRTAVPSGSICVPRRFYDRLGIDESKDAHDYLIAKPETVEYLIEMSILVQR